MSEFDYPDPYQDNASDERDRAWEWAESVEAWRVAREDALRRDLPARPTADRAAAIREALDWIGGRAIMVPGRGEDGSAIARRGGPHAPTCDYIESSGMLVCNCPPAGSGDSEPVAGERGASLTYRSGSDEKT